MMKKTKVLRVLAALGVATMLLASCGGGSDHNAQEDKPVAGEKTPESKIKAEWVGRWKVVSSEGEKLDGQAGTVYTLDETGLIKVGGFKTGEYKMEGNNRIRVQFEGYGEKPFEADLQIKEGGTLKVTKYSPDNPEEVVQTLEMAAYK